ncbi:UDP-glucuronosyl/UDP-glucosyltransferase [Trema orientale]|uniref:Glycosyltransferase n=1 Tax=Trema orientale TaxID=63057 RepID=A0A2P5AY72_TREOI|nr:UDP-glucuronosyl/UDP-glucosyltransferase [Trema orientale]
MATLHGQHHHKNQASSSSVVVVMVPFAAQSHLNQFLQMAYVVSSHDMPVHFVSSALHNSQVKSRASNSTQQSVKIHFHDLLVPLNRYAKTKASKNQIYFEITMSLRQPVAALLRSLSLTARRLVIIYDILMASAVQDVVSLPNAEAYVFNCASAFSAFAIRCNVLGQNHKIPTKEVPLAKSCSTSFERAVVIYQGIMSYYKAGVLNNSCRAIEGPFLEQLANDNNSGKKMWAVGPLHPTTTNFQELRDKHKCLLEWLDKQEPKSVLFISFGTTVTFSDEQVREIALGLEQSGVKFILVLREEDKLYHLSDEQGRKPKLPNAFEDRVKEMGKVVRKWVPQVEILGHPSTGGFLSHCGWNSCMESITMGVPIATWPMKWDQPFNAVLITEVLKVGVAVMEWRQRDEVVTSSRISEAVRKLMASEYGDEIRKRVVDMGEAVKQSIAEGGDSRSEWDSFFAHITREGSSVKYHKIRSFVLKLFNSVIEFLVPLLFGLKRF